MFIYAYIYIYVCVCAGELVSVPPFGLSRVSFCTASRDRNCTTSWGTIFTTKMGCFEDFVSRVGANLWFVCSVFHQLVTSFLLVFIFPNIFASFQKAFFEKNGELCS